MFRSALAAVTFAFLCNSVHAANVEWSISNRFRSFDYFHSSSTPEGQFDRAGRLFGVFLFDTLTNNGTATTVSEVSAALMAMNESPWRAENTGPWTEDPYGKNPGYDRDFVALPDRLFINVRLVDGRSRAGTCHWTLGDSVVAASCVVPALLEIGSRGGHLTVKDDAGLEVGSEDVAPAIKVIAGIGDSYAAGEGSPDVPTKWKPETAHHDWHLFTKHDANKMLDGSANWFSNRCNRSFYSYQSLVALTLASRDPHTVVSFVHVACAGAEVIDGLLAPQRQVAGRIAGHCPASVDPQKKPRKGYPDPKCDVPKSQLRALVETVCNVGSAKPFPEELLRPSKEALANLHYAPFQPEMISDLLICPPDQVRTPIDLILLSIGGNDMGFAGVIAWGLITPDDVASKAFVKGNVRVSYKALGRAIQRPIVARGNVVCPTKDEKQFFCDEMTAQDRIEQLPTRMAVLHSILETVLPPARVVINTYPNPLHDVDMGYCPDDDGLSNPWYAIRFNFEFGIPFLYVRDFVKLKLPTTREGVIERKVSNRLNDQIRTAANTYGWKVGEAAHAFDGGGWCVGSQTTLGNGSESLSDWHPYAHRSRYIQTINDSFRTQWSQSPLDSGFSGSVHPNPYGYAKMGEAAMSSISR